ncbi:SF1B family DNA helicase RecD2 [Candidatus Contubernalis alkaliaceticus]|uniref:SF1B family DNA helicase RecD2 n=1 Tax=Candidatus Contubernalis alkaliaceticus TaxID=338645 RepID=UPI001F4C360D|nr:ATP-dependent RecD-like DNA helicase [Candidatus Contubernalis alkalaceticus]
MIEGTLQRITYRNEENDFTVAKLMPLNKNQPVTVVGVLPSLSPGESLKLEGQWVVNPKFGKQFKVENFQSIVPKTLEGIERYLGSGCIKGIGPVTAKNLVACFGQEVLEIIEKHSDRLCQVEGIGEKKVEMITQGFEEQKDMREVIMFLQAFEVTPGLAAKIYRHYGRDTLKCIQENPYRLAEIMGIGFKTADKIALKLGMDPRSSHRIKAAVKFVLWGAASQGHVFLPEEEVFQDIQGLFSQGDVDIPLVAEQIQTLVKEKEVFIQSQPEDNQKLIYLAPFYYAEKGVARRILELTSWQRSLDQPSKMLPIDSGYNLTSKQHSALGKAMEEGVLIITGGPGTGKTTTIKALIDLFEKNNLKVMLSAPTGRAARRMSEASGREAKTIHRLLEYSHQEGEFRFLRNEENPLKTQVLIVDEVSMVDLLLMYHLLKALPMGSKLVLVGDMDQLPSVGAGNVLRSLIGSGVIPVVTLDKIFRQAGESLIIVNAHRINRGEFPVTNEKNKDFYFIQEEDPDKINQVILDLCKYRISKYIKLDPLEDIQVITPMRRTLVGVENLNKLMQKSLNPSNSGKKEIMSGGEAFRLGDKVMQIKNNYQKEVYNGDIGRISAINSEEGELLVTYPDVIGSREVQYNFNELEELVLSYAISVHKSQGSEYPVVILPLITQHFMLLQRNLLYTAITRARKLVVVVGTRKALAIALKNNRVEQRYTLLGERLSAEHEVF